MSRTRVAPEVRAEQGRQRPLAGLLFVVVELGLSGGASRGRRCCDLSLLPGPRVKTRHWSSSQSDRGEDGAGVKALGTSSRQHRDTGTHLCTDHNKCL